MTGFHLDAKRYERPHDQKITFSSEENWDNSIYITREITIHITQEFD